MGGFSAEREISLLSGEAVYQSLLKTHSHVIKLVVGRDIICPILKVVAADPNSFVFIALHGKGGEDGMVQGALEAANIPYSGSQILPSAIAMDKEKTKWIWNQNNIPTPASRTFKCGYKISESEAEKMLVEMGPVLFVKPVREGSSVGMSKVSHAKDVISALDLAYQYHTNVLVEHCVQGEEYTVSILGEQVLPSIRLQTPRAFYDYKAKYQTHTTEYYCPSGLNSADENELAQLCYRAFKVLDCTVWGRVDVLRDSVKGWQLLEVNTVPGMTEKSLVPMAARESGINFDELVRKICELSLLNIKKEGIYESKK